MSRNLIYPKKYYPTKEQRKFCVRLAKDVITQLMFKKNIEVETGDYCYFTFKKDEDKIINNFDNSLKELITKGTSNEYKCKVCALGSLFLSKVKLYNEVCIDEICIDYTYPVDSLAKDIGGMNATLIECAFEQTTMDDRTVDDPYYNGYHYSLREESISLDHMIFKAAYSFESKDPRKRLFAICRNIIRNKGIFVPRGFSLK